MSATCLPAVESQVANGDLEHVQELLQQLRAATAEAAAICKRLESTGESPKEGAEASANGDKPWKRSDFDQIVCKRFVLCDKQGRTRIGMGMLKIDDRQYPAFQLSDEVGQVRADLSVDDETGALMRFRDADGNLRLIVQSHGSLLNGDGAPEICLLGPRGTRMITLKQSSNLMKDAEDNLALPLIELHDDNGEEVWNVGETIGTDDFHYRVAIVERPEGWEPNSSDDYPRGGAKVTKIMSYECSANDAQVYARAFNDATIDREDSNLWALVIPPGERVRVEAELKPVAVLFGQR